MNVPFAVDRHVMNKFRLISKILLITLASICMQPATARQEPENSGNSALMMAAYDGDLDTLRKLVDQGDDVNQTNKYGFTAIFFAAGGTRTQSTPKGSTEAVKFLLQHGAKANNKSNVNGYTALMAACANQNAGSVSLLLDNGADVNALTKDGESALSIAASRLEPEIVKLILSHGAHVTGIKDRNGQTPLIAAIAASPPLNFTSSNAASDYIYKNAAVLSNAVTVVGLLLSNNTDTNVKDKSGKSALTYAVAESNSLLVKALLKQGANPNITDQSEGNATPLILAVKVRSLSIAEMLIKSGANVNMKDQFGKTALDYAIERGPKRMVDVLSDASKR